MLPLVPPFPWRRRVGCTLSPPLHLNTRGLGIDGERRWPNTDKTNNLVFWKRLWDKVIWYCHWKKLKNKNPDWCDHIKVIPLPLSGHSEYSPSSPSTLYCDTKVPWLCEIVPLTSFLRNCMYLFLLIQLPWITLVYFALLLIILQQVHTFLSCSDFWCTAPIWHMNMKLSIFFVHIFWFISSIYMMNWWSRQVISSISMERWGREKMDHNFTEDN